MPLVADRVMETSTTTGTGTYTLAGAKTGYQAFTSAFSTGAKVYYCATDGTDWEVGVGTFTTVGTTLSRDSIFASSNAGSAVNWAAGTRDVFCTAPMQSVVGTPRIQGKTGAYTVVASDNGSIINCTSGTFTVSLTAAATLGSGFTCWVWNTSTTSTDAITVDPNSTETIDGLATLVLRPGEGFQIVCNGTNWLTADKKAMRGYAENYPAADARPVASGNRSTAIGVNSGGTPSQALGAGSMALNGSYATGTDSFAASVGNNTSTYGAQNNGAIAIGAIAKASTIVSTAIGYGAIASGSGSAVSIALGQATASGLGSVAIGSYYSAATVATASGQQAVAIGEGARGTATTSFSIGFSSLADQTNGFALGQKAYASVKGKLAYSGYSITGTGGSQIGFFVLVGATTNATAKVLTTDTTAADGTNQIILLANSAYAFTGTVVARQSAAGGTASAAWKVEGLIRREATAASTTLVASTVTAIDNTPGWTLALSADTTYGGLAVTATGAAATNIRWSTNIQTAEIVYA